MKRDGSVALTPRLTILPVKIFAGDGRDVTPRGLRWSLATTRGGTWLQLRLADATLPTPYVIDPSIALTGTCPNAAGQTDLAGSTSASVIANGCSASIQSGTNGSTALALTAPQTLSAGDVMIALISVRSTGAITAPTAPTAWTQIGTTQTNGTGLAQYLYYRVAVAGSDTGGTTTYQWSIGAKADMSGGIVAYSGV